MGNLELNEVAEQIVVEVMRAGLVSFVDLDVESLKIKHLYSFEIPIEDKITILQAISRLNNMLQMLSSILFVYGLSQKKFAE